MNNDQASPEAAVSSSPPLSCSELLECLEWTASNMDCLSLCCTCCDDKRRQLVDVLTRAGVIDKPEYDDLRQAIQNIALCVKTHSKPEDQ